MKKIIVLGLVLGVLLTVLTSCGSKVSTDSKDDDHNGADSAISADLDAKASAEADVPKADMNDMDALYKFVNAEFFDTTRENFDKWDIYYYDITGDGSEEAVLVCAYGEEWHDKMEIISGDNGKYERIPSDIPLAKYENTSELKDNFFAVTTKTGGTGELMAYLNLYVYNGTGMINVLEGLYIEHSVTFPDADFVETATIDGSYNAFTYTLTKHDNLTDNDTTEVKDQYTYNADTMSYTVEPIDTQVGTSGNDNVIDIEDLKVGGLFEGATISKISLDTYGYSMADFELELTGEFILVGTLAYSEFEDSIIFTVDESKYPTEIRLSDDLGTFNPFGWPMGFRNTDVLIEQLGEVTYNKLLSEPGYYVGLKVNARDYDFYCTIPGQAGGSWELQQILEIKN